MDPRNLAGPLKVAMLINSLGEEASQAMLHALGPSEQEKIKKLIPQLKMIPTEVVDKVAREFIESARRHMPSQAQANAGGPFQKGLPQGASPSNPSGDVKPQALQAAEAMDPDQLVQLIRDEHPQTLALMLSHLSPDLAGEVLALLPATQRADIALRIARLGKINPWMLDEIQAYLTTALDKRIPNATTTAGGVTQLAEIMKRLDADVADTIMEHIENDDDDLADGINQMLFVFDDIVLVDDKGMQQLLRNVETQDLAVAMKAAAPEARDKIFSNMSQRASAMLTEEIDSMGPVRMADVTEAQQKIIRVIQEMEKKGELMIKGVGGEEFIG
jgi:flagellar motor switch protein FliG